MISIIITGWEQSISWIMLFFILYSLISDKIHSEAAIFGSLLLGLLRIASTALITVVIVMVISAGIVNSWILPGLGTCKSRLSNEVVQIFC